MQDDRDFRNGEKALTEAVRSKRRKALRTPTAPQARPNKKSAAGRPVNAVKRSTPVQLTIFDYAAAIGVTLLPEGS